MFNMTNNLLWSMCLYPVIASRLNIRLVKKMYVYYTVKSMEAEGVEPSSATVDFAFKLHQHPLCPQGASPVPKEKRAVWGSEANREKTYSYHGKTHCKEKEF